MKTKTMNACLALLISGSCLLLAAAIPSAAAPGHSQPAYSVTDLGEVTSLSSESAFPGYTPTNIPIGVCIGTRGITHMFSFFQQDYGVHFSELHIVGQVVVEHQMHAFVLQNAKLTDLGTLPGGAYSSSSGLNHRGQVVGYSYIHPYGPVWHAFLYRAGQMIDLNTRIGAGSGWVLENGGEINDAGQIVGVGRHHGKRRLFLLTPQ